MDFEDFFFLPKKIHYRNLMLGLSTSLSLQVDVLDGCGETFFSSVWRCN